MSAPEVAVVGHVEWVQFARVAHVPSAGEVMHASEAFEEPAGGGAVAAVQLARLAGAATLVTALGEDDHGRRSLARLDELGVHVEASFEREPTRRAVTLVDDAHERTITTFGRRLEPPAALVSSSMDQIDGVYFTAGDAAALESARAATRVLLASPRARHALGHGVELDALVLSAGDAVERSEAGRAEGEARLEVWTEGAKGGSFRTRDGESGRWAAAPLPGEPRDSYGCGDSFAAGLTFGLAAGMDVQAALALAARCGAACATGHGPYEHQLTAADL